MKKQQHVVRRGNNWAVRGANNSRDTITAKTQADAIKVARQIAIKQKGEVVIQGRDGRIRDLDSYGNDSCPPRDKKY